MRVEPCGLISMARRRSPSNMGTIEKDVEQS